MIVGSPVVAGGGAVVVWVLVSAAVLDVDFLDFPDVLPEVVMAELVSVAA